MSEESNVALLGDEESTPEKKPTTKRPKAVWRAVSRHVAVTVMPLVIEHQKNQYGDERMKVVTESKGHTFEKPFGLTHMMIVEITNFLLMFFMPTNESMAKVVLEQYERLRNRIKYSLEPGRGQDVVLKVKVDSAAESEPEESPGG